jgi:sugar/nucleoside kinase (ribokinase family)
MGCAVVALKLGDHGLYVRTTGDRLRMASAGRLAPRDIDSWVSREIMATCFDVNVVGTTGSGDCTIAGFLAGMANGLGVGQAATAATAVGACSVEAADSTSAVPPWQKVQERIAAGWLRRSPRLPMPAWRHDVASGLWIGPHDRT